MWALSELGNYRSDFTGPGIAFGIAGLGFVLMSVVGRIGDRLYGENWHVKKERWSADAEPVHDRAPNLRDLDCISEAGVVCQGPASMNNALVAWEPCI